MATLTAVKFNAFLVDVMHKKHNLSSDQLKCMLSNVAPNASTGTVKANITEISAGSGYAAGGANVTRASSGLDGAVYKYIGSGTVAWTSTGTIGPFRYPVIYNDTATNDELVEYFDIGSAVTLNSGDSYTLNVAVTLISLT